MTADLMDKCSDNKASTTATGDKDSKYSSKYLWVPVLFVNVCILW